MARFRRGPDKPTDLHKRSWLATLRRSAKEFSRDNLTDWAAALTYYAVLSLFPAIIALISILGLVVDPATITRVITDVVSQLGPKSAVDTFKGPIDQIAGNRSGALLGLILGVAAALWTASGYVGAFMRAANAIYDVQEGRSFWKRRPMQVVMTFGMVFLLALVLLALVLTGSLAVAIGDAIGVGRSAVDVWNIAKWPVLMVVVMTMFAFLYYLAPNVRQPGFRWITPGGVLAVLLWIVASAGFGVYIAHIGSYDKTYGTLSTVIVLLVWLWITNLALLLGAEFDAELERERQLLAGLPAEDRIQLPPREPAK
jgi:membrane protein